RTGCQMLGCKVRLRGPVLRRGRANSVLPGDSGESLRLLRGGCCTGLHRLDQLAKRDRPLHDLGPGSVDRGAQTGQGGEAVTCRGDPRRSGGLAEPTQVPGQADDLTLRIELQPDLVYRTTATDVC